MQYAYAVHLLENILFLYLFSSLDSAKAIYALSSTRYFGS